MIMIDVLNMMAKGEIKDGTKLEVHDSIGRILEYTFYGKLKAFHDERFDGIDRWFSINESFLNFDVKLIPPKEKKYLVKFNMRGLDKYFRYLNYVKKYEYVSVGDKVQTESHQTRFAKKEMQSIKPVREFLEDMEGKYELIEVDEDETN